MRSSDQENVSTLHTRASLLLRVRQWEDSASWAEFYRLYRRLIYGLARRSGLSHADAEDVTQDVFKCVAETIHEFESNPERGTFRGWLMNLTRWRIADKFNSRPRAERAPPPVSDTTSTQTAAIERVPDDVDRDTIWDEEWQHYLLEAASERIARRVKPRHFQAFDLYARQRRPVLQVARELGMNPATIYLISHRLTKELKSEVATLRKQLG